MPGKRGAPKGNRNAVKHGFYSKARAEERERRARLAEAGACEGLDDEIAVLRLKIRQLTKMDPDNVALLIMAMRALARLVKTRYELSGG